MTFDNEDRRDITENTISHILQREGEAPASHDARDEGGGHHGQGGADILHVALVDLCFCDPLGLRPPVLEPDLDLGFCQLKLCCEF